MAEILWIDLETRSNCDLKIEGLARYVRDPSTELLMMSWAFDDGPVQSWFAEDEEHFPAEVIRHFRSGAICYAQNAAFERNMFDFVISNDYDFDPPALHQWRCSSARAMAHGLPGALEDICRAMDLRIKKMPEGTRLIRDYCSPGYLTEWKPGDRELMQDYCETDVETMRMFCSGLRELEEWEWEQYHYNEIMNDRGVPIDVPFVEAALDYAEDIKADVNERISSLTDGAVVKATQRKVRDEWLRANLDDKHLALITTKQGKIKFDKDHRAALAAAENLPRQVYDFVELCEQAGGATISKYKAMSRTHVDGWVHGAFIWNGAGQTGRWVSRGIQLQNMRRDTPKQPEALIVDVIEGYELVRPAEMLGRLIRCAITYKDGVTFSDYSQIEARVLPWLTDDPRAQKTLDIFRQGRDVYTENAYDMFSLSEGDEVDADTRQGAKMGVLACLSGGTLVVTDSGPKPITTVTCDDRLWDGLQWVTHEGLVERGERQTICIDGVRITQDHWIKTRDQWKQAHQLASNLSTLESARETGLASLRSLVLTTGQQAAYLASWLSAPAGLTPTPSWTTACEQAALLDATLALRKPRPEPTRGTPMSSQTPNSESLCWGEFQPLSAGVATPKTKRLRTMARGVSKFMRRGWRIVKSFCATCPGWMASPTYQMKLTVSTTTGATNPGTSGSAQSTKTTLTVAPSQNSKRRSPDCEPVYDIANAGPLNRFTILTDRGAMVVHNCGFGGGKGAVQAMARGYGIDYSDDEADGIKSRWRAANPWAEPFWYGLREAARDAFETPGMVYGHGKLKFCYDGGDWLWMMLPSGRCLAYFQPKIELVTTPWGDEEYDLTCVWGSGKPKAGQPWPRRTLNHLVLAENATQATAADIMREAIVRAEKACLYPILTVHDEMAVLGNHVDQLHHIMETAPSWTGDLPIAADTQFSMRYGK